MQVNKNKGVFIMLRENIFASLIVLTIMMTLILVFPGNLMADGHMEGPGIEKTGEIIMAYLNPENEGEIHNMDYVTDDVTYYDMSMGGMEAASNREDLADYLYWFYNVAFEADTEIRNLVIGNGEAVLEWTMTGTHIGEFAEVPPTGNTIEVPMIIRYQLQDEEPYHIERGWIYPMVNILMAQLLAE